MSSSAFQYRHPGVSQSLVPAAQELAQDGAVEHACFAVKAQSARRDGRYRSSAVGLQQRLRERVKDDGSDIGINYADAYIKPFKKILEDGRKVSCKRRGLELTLKIGDKTGKGLMRRLANGPEVKTILREALDAAATDAGVVFAVEDGVLILIAT